VEIIAKKKFIESLEFFGKLATQPFKLILK
jgi:hypothetical protein